MTVLDSECTKIVAAKVWLEEYVKILSEPDKKCVEYLATDDIFQFGDWKEDVASTKVLAPALISEKRVMISVTVVDNNIPLPLCQYRMKLTHTTMYFMKDEVTMLWKKLFLATPVSGHYYTPIYPVIIQDDSSCKGKITLTITDTFRNNRPVEKGGKPKKLYFQFACIHR